MVDEYRGVSHAACQRSPQDLDGKSPNIRVRRIIGEPRVPGGVLSSLLGVEFEVILLILVKTGAITPHNEMVQTVEWKRFRIGLGHDTHRLKPGGPLLLGGIDIPFGYSAVGHSDADVLLHAVTDSILGAATMGDIGDMFPDTDPRQ